MSWTKRQFVMQALEEIGYGYTYQLQPDQLQSALRKLDGMMAQWNANGLRLGYPTPSTPEDSSLDDESNVPDAANEAIYLGLALRLAPSFGKQITIEVKQFANEAKKNLYNFISKVPEIQPSVIPSGAGYKATNKSGYAYTVEPTDNLRVNNDGELIFE